MLVSTGGVLTYAWWHAPELIERELRGELESRGFSLVNFSMKRPRGWSFIINRISLVSKDLQIEISGLEFSPASAVGLELSVHINDARVALVSQESSEPSTLDWRTVIGLFRKNIPLVPLIGKISHLELCQQTCFEGEFAWFRNVNHIEAHFEQSSTMTLAEIDPESINISLSGSGEFIFLLNANLQLKNELRLSGQGWFREGTRPFHFDEKEPVRYAVDVESLSAEFSADWPIDGIIADLKQDITGVLLIDASPSWKVQLANSQFSSDQPIGLKIETEHGIIHSTLITDLDIRLENPYLDSSLLSITSGLSCTIDSDIGCLSEKMVITSHEDIYDTRVELTNASIKLHGSDWLASALAESSLFENGKSIFSSLMEVTADNKRILASSSTADFLGLGNVIVNIEHSFLTERGVIAINIEQPAKKFMGIIGYLAIDDFEPHSGTIRINMNLVWDFQADDQPVDLDLKLVANGLDITVGTFELEQGTIDIHLGGWGTLRSTTPANMSWQHIDIGVPVENVESTFDLLLSQTELKLSGQSLVVDVFGGQISSQNFNYDVIEGTGMVNLELDRLELNQILALQQEDFESSGKISGSVPVQINRGTVSVTKGMISAIEPGGFIRYKPGQAVVNMLTGNEQLKVVVETMEDFQYDKLEVELEYSPEGQLVARTTLQGSNPAYENGREVHLNIKLEENIAALLESLRLGDEITRKIGERNSGVKQ